MIILTFSINTNENIAIVIRWFHANGSSESVTQSQRFNETVAGTVPTTMFRRVSR